MTSRAESVSSLLAELSAERRTVEAARVSFDERAQDARERLRLIDAQLSVLRRLSPSSNHARPTEAAKSSVQAVSVRAPRIRQASLSQDIMGMVSSNHGGLTSKDLADRLAPTLRTSSKKPARRIVTNRVYHLRSKGKLVEIDGKLWLADRV